MSEQVIEGRWEELIQRQDLRGRRVRVVIIGENPARPAGEHPWVKQLREWAQGHPKIDHFVDDSRESIYGGTIDAPR